jgi:hypothetical protein
MVLTTNDKVTVYNGVFKSFAVHGETEVEQGERYVKLTAVVVDYNKVVTSGNYKIMGDVWLEPIDTNATNSHPHWVIYDGGVNAHHQGWTLWLPEPSQAGYNGDPYLSVKLTDSETDPDSPSLTIENYYAMEDHPRQGGNIMIEETLWPANGTHITLTKTEECMSEKYVRYYNTLPDDRFESLHTDNLSSYGESVGACGDPYITTLSGITYKMADFTGFSRMLQGTLENKPFTLNTETTLLTKEELTELAIERNKLFGKVTEGYEVDEFPAYFSKLHASWGEDSVTIDLKDFKVIQSTTNETYDIESGTGKQYNWSTKETEQEKMLIPFGPVTLVVKNIPNPDVRNGFTILGSSHIKDKVGALVKPMYVKDIKLKSLTSTKLIKDVKERTPKKIIQQEFRVKGGEIIEKDMPIY